MKDDLGYPLACVEELKERIAELEAKYAEAERLRLYNLEQVANLGKDNSDWQKAYKRMESLVRDLAQALLPYRMEHSKNNCYYAGDAGPICDECQAVDELLLSRVPKELL